MWMTSVKVNSIQDLKSYIFSLTGFNFSSNLSFFGNWQPLAIFLPSSGLILAREEKLYLDKLVFITQKFGLVVFVAPRSFSLSLQSYRCSKIRSHRCSTKMICRFHSNKVSSCLARMRLEEEREMIGGCCLLERERLPKKLKP